MHTAQSMHSSGSITNMFGPSRKQSTGQTSTQSVYLQRIQDSVTTWVIFCFVRRKTFDFIQGPSAPLRTRRLACTENRAFIELRQGRVQRTNTAPEVLWLAVSTSTSEPRRRERA